MVLAATLIGTWEAYGMARNLGQNPHAVAGLVAAASVAGAFFDERLPMAAALALVVVLPMASALARADLGPGALADVAITQSGALLLSLPLGFMMAIRLLEAERASPGDLIMLLFVSTWGADSAAYYVGRTVGRHKLAPRVSPKKTWEGAVGGIFGALAGALLYRQFLWGGATPVPVASALVVGGVVAVLGPPGDLAESVLKRSAGVKDSGRLFPGHGGILDRLDSLLFTAPVLYYYYRLAL